MSSPDNTSYTQYIILDSTVLRSEYGYRSVQFDVLRRHAKSIGAVICVPEVVHDEICWYLHNINDGIDKLSRIQYAVEIMRGRCNNFDVRRKILCCLKAKIINGALRNTFIPMPFGGSTVVDLHISDSIKIDQVDVFMLDEEVAFVKAQCLRHMSMTLCADRELRSINNEIETAFTIQRHGKYFCELSDEILGSVFFLIDTTNCDMEEMNLIWLETMGSRLNMSDEYGLFDD